MSNNTTTNAGSGGDTFTALDISTFSAYPTTGKLPASVIYVGSATNAAPTPLSNANPLPVSLQNSSIAVTGTFWQATQPISAASLPLPTGAATAAKQPALGTAGTASTDVLTVQGIASMTALKVDGSAVTQPVSGTFWQATQPVSGTVTANAGTGTFNVQQTNVTTDYDTGAGTQTMTMFGLALPASGGAVAGGTATNPIQVSLANTAANATAVKVDGSAVTQPVSGTVAFSNTTIAVTQSGSWSLAAHQSTNVDQWNGTAVDTNSGLKSAGTLRVVLATDQPALTNKLLVTADAITFASAQPVTQSGTWNAGLSTGANNAGFFTPAPAGATVGATPFKLTAAANSTNATSLKGSAGTLWDVVALNVSASAVAYLKFYDKATAPTVGTDTPVYVVPLPTAGSANGAGCSKLFPVGLKFANGIAYAITGGMGDADTTAIAANQVMLSGSYL